RVAGRTAQPRRDPGDRDHAEVDETKTLRTLSRRRDPDDARRLAGAKHRERLHIRLRAAARAETLDRDLRRDDRVQHVLPARCTDPELAGARRQDLQPRAGTQTGTDEPVIRLR